MGFRADLWSGHPFAFEKLTIGVAASGLTAATFAAANNASRAESALITVETNSIRVRLDGVAPDATTGHLYTAGSSFIITGVDALIAAKFIRATADAVIQVTYLN